MAVSRTTLPSNLFGLGRDALAESLVALGGRPYNGAQAFRWMYARRSFDPSRWSDFPAPLRERVIRAKRIDPGALVGRAQARDGTVKYRVRLSGGGAVEAVHMIDRGRVTLCLSSQLGCALDCSFCLTAKMGLVRHLEAGEIVGQVALLQEACRLEGCPFNVVFMGMGEPLHNYEGIVSAVRLLTDDGGFGLSRRRITVSTAGLAPAIEKLAREPVRPRLAVSLNATTDALRDRLMPVNRRYPLGRLLEALDTWHRVTGERFTVEYVLLAGVNDSEDEIRRLGKIVKRLPAKLNLIPFNPVPGWLEFRAPERDAVLAIRDRLLADAVPVSVRWSHGGEARAACGQLAVLPGDPEP